QSYVAQYRYDTAIGFRSGADYQVAESDYFNQPNVSPLVSARITINGLTVSVVGDYNNLYYRSNSDSDSEIATFVTGRTSVFNDFNRLNVDFLTSGPAGDAVTIDLNAPYAQTFDPNDGVNGTFLYYAADNSNYSFAALTGETLTISLAGGVPEPASWAMMIAGFGLVGTALRRQQGRFVAA
ncbi:MAG: PEPxxWA-CTERM sorting domain-containing protein, partial [Polymorphobacter sp.]